MADDKKTAIIQSFLDFDFKAARAERAAQAKAKREADMKVFLAGPDLESTIQCMRYCCHEMRWTVPTTSSILCREHTLEVLRGECRAPPIRRNLDYYAPGRKTFLVEDLGEADKKT
jgi:hypothetical protein